MRAPHDDLPPVAPRTRGVPRRTDDLTVLIEQLGAALDLYADLSSHARGIQGVTECVPGRRPLVRIARRLSDDPRSEHRLRTTLTHECGHVWLHGPLWAMGKASGNLRGIGPHRVRLCQREGMIGAPTLDWMEWQAGYVSGALLMPATYLWKVIRRSRPGYMRVRRVMDTFGVSAEAARVRLYLRDHAQHIPGNKGPTAAPTAAVVFALFAPVTLVHFAVDNAPIWQLHGLQDYHRIVCEAVGIDHAWYQGAAAGQNSLLSTTPP